MEPVDLVSSSEEEFRPRVSSSSTSKKRRIVSSSSSESSEADDNDFDDDLHQEAEPSMDFDQFLDDDYVQNNFDDDDNAADESPYNVEEEIHLVESQENDEEFQRMEAERVVILDDLKALDSKERKLEEELIRVQTMIATISHQREELKRKLASFQLSGNKDKTWSSESFPHSKVLRREMLRKFGFHEFRELQLQAMNATLCNKDCFVVLPTGSGKSLLFQLPAVIQGGVTLVISPLISLSRDQILNLEEKKISALMISSAQSVLEIKNAYVRLKTDRNLRLVYVTPEMLIKSKKFVSALEDLQRKQLLTRICIDEAHCCSLLGHDFRPDYQKLFILRRQFPRVPILCVTATATIKVEEDVRNTLNLGQDWVSFRGSFNRANLFFQVREKPKEHAKFVMQLVNLISKEFPHQSGIVYCFSRKDTEKIAAELNEHNISARCYHSKVNPAEQAKTHDLWRSQRVKVVVATTSFGMGIDMPQVRFVIHATLSTSMEGYVQESGRAGRDGLPAHCIVLYRRADILKISTLVSEKKNGTEKLLEMTRYCENVLLCRRTFVGQCFGEDFDSAKCLDSCDVCQNKNQQAGILVDHTLQAENCLRKFLQLKHVSATSQITANQLLEAWRKPTGRFKAPSQWSSSDCERLIVHMMIFNVLRIVFGYTSYGANAYVEQGEMSRALCTQQDGSLIRVEYGVLPSPKSAPLSPPPPTTTTTTKSTMKKKSHAATTTTTTPVPLVSDSKTLSAFGFTAPPPVAITPKPVVICAKKPSPMILLQSAALPHLPLNNNNTTQEVDEFDPDTYFT